MVPAVLAAAAGLVSVLFWLQADTPAAINNANTDFVTIDAFILIVFILKNFDKYNLSSQVS
ncbi:hypothetical protein GCM10007352_23340 [Mucilaginibacter phyllosphaerae]|nr:hypothetical protein GCM10007352_23340 [Mucilaginibacter phyllosphaerae]